MDSKKFNVLAIAALASFVTAGIVHSAYDTWSVENAAGTRVFPQFDAQASSIAQVKLQKGEATFTFDKVKDGQWILSERGGYPAEAKKIQELVGKVARAEFVQAKTKEAKRYDLLELGDPAKKDATASLIKINDAKGKSIAELVVGKRRGSAFGRGRSGSYLRKPDNPQTWLANLVIRVPMGVPDWVTPTFFRLPLDKVKAVEVLPPDGDPVNIVLETAGQPKKATDSKTAKASTPKKKADPKFKFVAIPDGKQLKRDVDATVMAKAFETLELTDVNKAGSVKAPKGSTTISAKVETIDGMKFEATMLKIGGDDRWLTIKVVEDGSDKKAAEALKKSVSGWQFKIPDWRSRQIFKTHAEMFEAKDADPTKSGAGQSLKPPAGLPVMPKQ